MHPDRNLLEGLTTVVKKCPEHPMPEMIGDYTVMKGAGRANVVVG